MRLGFRGGGGGGDGGAESSENIEGPTRERVWWSSGNWIKKDE